MAEVTTYAKLVPFGAVALIGLLFIDTSHFSEFNPSGVPLLQATAALAPLTMFAFLGLESATVPAGDVRDPERTIPRSTVLGITIAATLYVLGTIVVMGVLPRQQLVHSLAPFSDAAHVMWGRAGQISISIAVILSSIGALNGWTLLMGQVPMAAARDRLFPPSVRQTCRERDVPAIGIVVSAALATLLILVQAIGSGGFSAFYNLVVGLSTMAAVIPYAFCALAGSLVSARVSGGKRVPRVTAVEIVAFVFAMFTLYGCGAEPVLYGLVLLLLGIPVFVWQRRRTGLADGVGLRPTGTVATRRRLRGGRSAGRAPVQGPDAAPRPWRSETEASARSSGKTWMDLSELIQQIQLGTQRGLALVRQRLDEVLDHRAQPPRYLEILRAVEAYFPDSQLHKIIPIRCPEDQAQLP